jgi:hypothetical protein
MGAPADTLPTAASRLQTLARRGAATTRETVQERCETCGAPIAAQHRHLLDLDSRELLCTCRACAILFDRDGAGGGHFRLIGERRLRVTDFALDDLGWAQLRLPVDIAFFFHHSSAERVVAFYPSPMGATESLLTLDAWTELQAANPLLRTLEPDVEALLVDRSRHGRPGFGHWIVPIDECYRLVGLIRTTWTGLTGGKVAWQEIGHYFDDLDRRSRAVTQEAT